MISETKHQPIRVPPTQFQNRIPRELDQNFDTPWTSMIYRISYGFSKSHIKSYADFKTQNSTKLYIFKYMSTK